MTVDVPTEIRTEQLPKASVTALSIVLGDR
jgi:hypothetical protein